MAPEYRFDYDELYRLLLDAARKAFQDIQQQHANETFYSFMLITPALDGYIFAGASTEEELLRVAKNRLDGQQERSSHWYEGFTFQDFLARARHYLGLYDSFRDVVNKPHFEEINKRLDIRDTALFDVWSELAETIGDDQAHEEVTNPHGDQFEKTCQRVLKELDREGLFGTGETRLKVVVNLIRGAEAGFDAAVYLECATPLNPPEVMEWYRVELADAERVQRMKLENQARWMAKRREQKNAANNT